MQNFDKINPPFFLTFVNRPQALKSAKTFIRQICPVIFKFVPVSLVLLFFQAFLIGVADRLGISPKLGFLWTSLFYVCVFSGLALFGSSRRNEVVENPELEFLNEPVCKILTIKSKER